jgi:hypothetical protein
MISWNIFSKSSPTRPSYYQSHHITNITKCCNCRYTGSKSITKEKLSMITSVITNPSCVFSDLSLRSECTIRSTDHYLARMENVVAAVRSYNTTPVVAMSMRRRRRGGGLPSGIDDDNNNDESGTMSEQLSEKNNPAAFLIYSMKLLDKLHGAMLPLLKINDRMKISRGESSRLMMEEKDKELEEQQNLTSEEKKSSDKPDNKTDSLLNEGRMVDGPYLLIELGPIHGQYTFIIDYEYNTIIFQSPISGQLLYSYNVRTGNWMNVNDQHNLEGIFVRDIIRQIQGVPKL